MGTAGIVLAAGTATRMGENKVLLRVGEEALVRRVARAALEAGLDPVLMVVGHEAGRLERELADLPCRTVSNPAFEKGMNTSLDAGVGALPAGVAAAVVLLADMPFVDAAMVRSVVLRHEETGAPLVVSRYGSVLAPPTLYARALFAELRSGEGDGRGREVVKRQLGEAAYVDWPKEALLDVDVAEDLERARARLAKGVAR